MPHINLHTNTANALARGECSVEPEASSSQPISADAFAADAFAFALTPNADANTRWLSWWLALSLHGLVPFFASNSVRYMCEELRGEV